MVLLFALSNFIPLLDMDCRLEREGERAREREPAPEPVSAFFRALPTTILVSSSPFAPPVASGSPGFVSSSSLLPVSPDDTESFVSPSFLSPFSSSTSEFKESGAISKPEMAEGALSAPLFCFPFALVGLEFSRVEFS